VAGRPSIVVTSSVGLIFDTGTEQGLNALPLMWDVQDLQTLSPRPYFGPVMPRMSRRTHSRRTSSGAVGQGVDAFVGVSGDPSSYCGRVVVQ